MHTRQRRRCVPAVTFGLAVSLGILSLVASGCDIREQGCTTDQDCRYDRICDSRLQICLDPDNRAAPSPDTDDTGTRDTGSRDTGTFDTGPLPDLGAAEVIFADEFADGDLEGWTDRRSTRPPSFDGNTVTFEGTEGSGRHDSKAIWARDVFVDNLEDVWLQGRFQMGLDDRSRDQRTAIEFHLQSSGGDELGQISFYTRWEGRNGTLSDKCRADSGRGWCTYGGENPRINDDRTEFYRDIGARNEWRAFARSLEAILRNHLTGVPTDRLARIEIRIVSTGAWGTNSRGLFDYVRIIRRQ